MPAHRQSLCPRVEQDFVATQLFPFGSSPNQEPGGLLSAMKDELRFDYAVSEAPALEKCEWTPLPFHSADAFVGARPAASMVAPALTRTDQEIFRLELLHVLDCQRRGNFRTKREARAQVHERFSLALEELASSLDLLICGLPGDSQLKAAPDQAV